MNKTIVWVVAALAIAAIGYYMWRQYGDAIVPPPDGSTPGGDIVSRPTVTPM